jgi:DNA-binding beta-propeller fold protein YncE
MRRLLSAHVTSCLLLPLALGKKVTKVGEVEVGGLPEGAVFSADGAYLYVGNYVGDVSILKVSGTTITDTGKKLKLPGQPASMRGRAR